jgi:hypothetical protein
LLSVSDLIMAGYPIQDNLSFEQWFLEPHRRSCTTDKTMFPSHCKEVSVKSVDFELTEQSIKDFLKGKRAYIRTRFYIFNSGDDWAVALVVRKPSNGVLQEIASVHILSLPSETSFFEDPSLEVLSASVMGSARERMGTKCVVVKGRAEHISFFIDEPPYELTVVDVVPPRPSKLVGLVNNALETDLQDRYVKYKMVELDLNELASKATTNTIMFPCRASGLTSDKKVLYLDQTPDMTDDEVAQVTLIGCSLSARIFKAIYGSEPPRLINICPQDIVRESGIVGPVILKCCKIREGFESKGDVAVVPWGARANEVSGAIRAVIR